MAHRVVALAIPIGLRAAAYGNAPFAVFANACGALVTCLYVPALGTAIYNQAISDAQTRMQQRVADLAGELYADEFQYWPRADARRKARH